MCNVCKTIKMNDVFVLNMSSYKKATHENSHKSICTHLHAFKDIPIYNNHRLFSENYSHFMGKNMVPTTSSKLNNLMAFSKLLVFISMHLT